MRANRGRDTGPELALRSELHRMGLRYRVHRRPIPDFPAKADIVFGRDKVAVFVDGCFWHRCPEHATAPRANAEWWAAKLQANVDRDRRVDARLEESGWLVIRVWEHVAPQTAATDILRALQERRRTGKHGK